MAPWWNISSDDKFILKKSMLSVSRIWELHFFNIFWAQAAAKAESLQHSTFKKNCNKIKGLNLRRWWRKEMNMIEKLAVYLGNCDKFYFTFKFEYWIRVQIFQNLRRTQSLFAIYQTSQIWIPINQLIFKLYLIKMNIS